MKELIIKLANDYRHYLVTEDLEKAKLVMDLINKLIEYGNYNE